MLGPIIDNVVEPKFRSPSSSPWRAGFIRLSLGPKAVCAPWRRPRRGLFLRHHRRVDARMTEAVNLAVVQTAGIPGSCAGEGSFCRRLKLRHFRPRWKNVVIDRRAWTSTGTLRGSQVYRRPKMTYSGHRTQWTTLESVASSRRCSKAERHPRPVLRLRSPSESDTSPRCPSEIRIRRPSPA